MKTTAEPPGNLRSLTQRIRNLAGDNIAEGRLKRTIANVVVGQMLPAGAVKGGAAIKIRLGDQASRFTADLDMARARDLRDFLDEFSGALRAGWANFTGRIATRTPPRPPGVPAGYVMRPYDIKLSYHNQSWMTVPLELGRDEIGDTDSPDYALAADTLEVFATLGLPQPRPIAVLPISHQIAQKLHACTEPGTDRAHDLVDLQLLLATHQVDLSAVGDIARRLFRSRRKHSWPPTVTVNDGWPALYGNAREELPVLPDVDAAVAWTNNLIGRIERGHDTAS